MTTTQTEGTEVSRYLAAIRDSLADLPAEERDDLVDDLEEHLHEVLAESGTTLEASLGSPQEYAEELRATAGLQPGGVRRRRFAAGRGAWSRFAARPANRSVIGFLVELRPGWWLVRGWLVLFTAVLLTEGQSSGASQRSLWMPTYYGNEFRPGLTTLAVVLASGWLGTRTPGFSRPAKRLVFAFNVFVIGAAIFYLPNFVDSSDTLSFIPPQVQEPIPSGLFLDGRQLVNIYPYDTQGHLLTNVRLYDDRGQPLTGLVTLTGRGQHLVSSYPTDSKGHVVTNAFPQTLNVLPFSGPGATASQAALVQQPPPSGLAAISGQVPVPAPVIVVPPLATTTPVPTKTP
jgi:hypothetical protein